MKNKQQRQLFVSQVQPSPDSSTERAAADATPHADAGSTPAPESVLDASTLATMRAAAPALHNGTYTVSHPEKGHFTVKVHTAQQGALAGKRIISLLAGPDNTSDYRGVAFWDDGAMRAKIWGRFRGDDSRLPLDGRHFQERGWSVYEQKIAVFVALATGNCDACPTCGCPDFTRESANAPWACARCSPPRFADVEWRPAVRVLDDLGEFVSEVRRQRDLASLPAATKAMAGGFRPDAGYRMQRASRCLRCNRALTHPESLALGIGPECAGKA